MSQDLREQDLFSVIVLHYNQEKLIHTAFDSIFAQDYNNIELIVADDCTPGINTAAICSYIQDKKGNNISNTIFQFNTENLGTVRNANQAIKAAHGKYVLFFAADDSLWDKQTISNFAAALQSLPEDQYVASAQCYMMDVNLDEVFGPFVNAPIALGLNQESADTQNRKMAFSCMYAMGATAMKASVWEKFGYFDETYKIIEDWSFFLHLTRNGSKITYFNFGALKHRDGGVSHHSATFNQVGLPPHVLEYKNDLLLIQEREILPYLKNLPRLDQNMLLNKYEKEREAFKIYSVNRKRTRRIELVLKNKVLYLKKLVLSIIEKSPEYRKSLQQSVFGLLSAMLLMYLIIVVGKYAATLTDIWLPGMVYVQAGIWLVFGLLVLCVAIYLFMASLSTAYFLWKQKVAFFSSEK